MAGWTRWHIVGLVLVALSGCTDTYRWREQVLTHDGNLLEVSRQATFSARWLMRLTLSQGGGGNHGEQIEFSHRGELVRWVHPTERISNPNRATILDIVDGAPVIVVPIDGYENCSRHDFPLTEFVAFRWRGGAWQPIDGTTLPSALKENLLRNDVMRTELAEPFRGALVSLKDIASLQPDRKRRTLPQITNGPDPFNIACRYFMPPRNEANQAFAHALSQRIAAASQARGTVLGNGPRGLIPVSRDEVFRAIGHYNSGGLVRDCRALVETLRPGVKPTLINGRLELRQTGMEIVLAARLSPLTSITIPTTHQGEAVFCSDGVVYAISRRDRSTIAFFQFNVDEREPGPVHEITLPIPDSLPQTFWPILWDPRVVSGQLRFTLARLERYETAGGGELWDSYEVAVDLVQ